MKKLLYIFPKLTAGGAEKSALLIAGYLSKHYNYSVSFFSLSDYNYYDSITEPSIKLKHALPLKEKSVLHKWMNSYFLFYFTLLKYLRKNKYDIVISGYEIDAELPVIQIMLSRWFRKSNERFISIIQNSLRNKEGRYYSSRKPVILKCISLLRNLLFDSIVVVSPRIAKEFDAKTRTKVFTIPNPVDSNEVIKRSQEPIDAEYDRLIRLPFFINVARITPQKNQIFLLQAFQRNVDKTKSNLLLVGEVSNESYYLQVKKYILDSNLTNRVYLLDRPKNHFPLIKRSDSFLFSSDYEGLPLAVLEAMILRKTIISTKYDGYDSLLSNNNSILIEKNDIDGFADAMYSCEQNKFGAPDCQENAFNTAKQYELNKIADRYHQLFTISPQDNS